MKRGKQMIILLIVLVVLIAGVVGVKMMNKKADDIQNADQSIATVSEDDLSEISWNTEDGKTLDFKKTDDGWVSTDDESFPVDQSAMSDFLANFADVHASFVINDVEDYDQYGLKNPEYTITLTKSDDTKVVITLGDFSKMDSKRYVNVDDGNAYLIDDDLAEVLPTTRDDLMQKDELVSFDTLENLTVEGDAEADVIYKADADYAYTNANNYYLVDGSDYKMLSDNQVSTYFSKITGIDENTYVTYTAGDDDLKTYGLSDPALTLTVKGSWTDGNEKYDDDTEKPTEYTVCVGLKSGSDEKCYVRVGDSKIIYECDKQLYDDLAAASYDTLRPTAVESVDWDNVTSLDATIEGDTASIAFDKGLTGSVTYKMGDEEVDLQDALDSLDALTINTFNDDKADGTEEFSITIHQKNDKFPEVTIKAYKVDGDNCLITFNDETVGLAARSDVIDFKELMTNVLLGSTEAETETESSAY